MIFIRHDSFIKYVIAIILSTSVIICLILRSSHLETSHSSSHLETLELLKGQRDLIKCFGIFHAIHGMIKTKNTVSRIIQEVLTDFMEDNVIYLELRTTPRDLLGEKSYSISE